MINQDEVKALLLKLQTPEEDFSVLFSGKTSLKVNGLYKPSSKEIIIHNKNFTNDNTLIFTAIHEYTHHLMYCKYRNTGKLPMHTNEFWAIMYRLIAVAEEKGLYKKYADEKTKAEMQTLVDKVKSLDKEIAKLVKKMGEQLKKIDEKCTASGIRFEDITARECGLSKQTVTLATRAYAFNAEDIGHETQKAICAQTDSTKAQKIIDTVTGGETIYQAKQSIKKNVQATPDKSRMIPKELKMLTRGICFACSQIQNGASVAEVLKKAEISKTVAKACTVPECDIMSLQDIFDAEKTLAESVAHRRMYTSTETSRLSKPVGNDYLESVIMHTPELSYKYQIYEIVNGVIQKKQYRKTVTAALKTQCRVFGGERWHN